MRRRWVILLVGLPLYCLGLMVIGTVSLVLLVSDDSGAALRDIGDVFGEPGWWASASIIAGIISGSQAVFLLPVIQFRRARSERGKSLVISALLLAMVAGVLVTGLVSGFSELLGPWSSQATGYTSRIAADQPWFPAMFWSTLAGSWVIFSVLLIKFVRRSRNPEGRLGRIVGILLGGTAIEVIAIVPIDIMVRRRTDCYCSTGTFFALAFSIVATLWLTGPGLVIALTAKKRRAWFELHCEVCGYAKGPSPGGRCPECGFAWTVSPRCIGPTGDSV